MPVHASSNEYSGPSPSTHSGAVFHLPPRSEAARLGRRSVRETLAGAPDEVLERVELLVSELVTNSVTHSALAPDQGVELRVVTAPARVRVEVGDPGSPFDPRLRPDPGAESKWGLFILDEMWDRWGVERLKRGKKVWFEVDL